MFEQIPLCEITKYLNDVDFKNFISVNKYLRKTLEMEKSKRSFNAFNAFCEKQNEIVRHSHPTSFYPIGYYEKNATYNPDCKNIFESLNSSDAESPNISQSRFKQNVRKNN